MIDLKEIYERYFSDMPYEPIFMLWNGDKDSPEIVASLSCAQDLETPLRWNLIYDYSAVCFQTLAEARAFCGQRGWAFVDRDTPTCM